MWTVVFNLLRVFWYFYLFLNVIICSFQLVGYGCMTCIGNSGPLPEEVVKAIDENNLVAVGVLSGNRYGITTVYVITCVCIPPNSNLSLCLSNIFSLAKHPAF